MGRKIKIGANGNVEIHHDDMMPVQHFDSGGGVQGGLGGMISAQNDFHADAPQIQTQGNLAGQAGSLANVNSGLQDQQGNLAQALQAQAAGKGPNVAQDQLNQATGTNVANQSALMAGQRGAGANAGLLARQAAQQGAATQQQAAGQSAILGAQQQLGAQGQLAGLYNQQAQQALQGQQINQSALASQNATQTTGQLGASQINGQTAAANTASAGSAIGGLTSGVGAALSFINKGGIAGKDGKEDPKTAQVPQKDRFSGMQHFDAGGITNYAVASNPNLNIGATQGGSSIDGAALANGVGDQVNAILTRPTPGIQDAGIMAPSASQPFSTQYASKGGSINYLEGGEVPGEAKVAHDSPKNDTVPAMLSPGEGVLPLHVMDDEKKAAEFAKALVRKQQDKYSEDDFKKAVLAKKGERQKFADGGSPKPVNPISQGFNAATGSAGVQQAASNAKQYVQKKSDGGEIDEDAPQAPDKGVSAGSVGFTPERSQPLPDDNKPIPSGGIGEFLSGGPKPEEQDLVGAGKGAMVGQDATPAPVEAPGAIDSQMKAVKGALGTQEESADKQANAQQEAESNLEDLPSPQDVAAHYKQKDEELFQKIQDGKVDPQRYMHNKGIGGKFAAGIAIALSGLGNGIGGHPGAPNQALGVLQAAVDRDIDAQKNDQTKNENLWKMNRSQMNSDQEANLATKNQILTKLQVQTQGALQQSQSAQAKLNGQMLLGQLQQQKEANQLKLGILHQVNGNGTSQMDPAQAVQVMVPPAQQKEVLGEIAKRQNAVQAKDAIMEQFEAANKENTVLNKVSHLGATPASVARLDNLALPLIRDQDGRVNEFEYNAFKALIPAPGDLPDKVEAKKRGMEDFIASKMSAPVSKSVGLDLDKFASTRVQNALPPQQELIYKEAKDRLAKDPNDAVGKAALQRLGKR